MYNSKMKLFRIYLKCIENFLCNTKQLFHTHHAFNNNCARANPSQIHNSIFPLGFLINYLFNFWRQKKINNLSYFTNRFWKRLPSLINYQCIMSGRNNLKSNSLSVVVVIVKIRCFNPLKIWNGIIVELIQQFYA